jgi:hypothetical protein
MNVMTRALAIAGVLAAGTPAAVRAETADAQVTYEIHDFYHPSQTISDDFRLTAHNNATGEDFAPDREGTSFTLPVGNYTFSGRSQWCYVQPKTVEIAGDSDLVLLAGCE